MLRRPLLHAATSARLEAISPLAATSYIFHGPRSSGKRLAAIWLTVHLNCAAGGGDDCAICRQVEASNYPDLLVVEPEDKPSVTIEQIRRLLQALTLAPYRPNGVRIVIIDNAETLTPEAQNALLKNLEEPPENTRFILVTEAIEALLPTVRSRLAAQYFAPVDPEVIAAELEQHYRLKPAQAAQLAHESDGIVGRAIMLATSPETAAHRTELGIAVAGLLGSDMFARLRIVRTLIEAKQPAAELLTTLQRAVVAQLSAADDPASTQRFQALSHARRLLSAGVMPRVVLDRLALELS